MEILQKFKKFCIGCMRNQETAANIIEGEIKQKDQNAQQVNTPDQTVIEKLNGDATEQKMKEKKHKLERQSSNQMSAFTVDNNPFTVAKFDQNSQTQISSLMKNKKQKFKKSNTEIATGGDNLSSTPSRVSTPIKIKIHPSLFINKIKGNV